MEQPQFSQVKLIMFKNGFIAGERGGHLYSTDPIPLFNLPLNDPPVTKYILPLPSYSSSLNSPSYFNLLFSKYFPFPCLKFFLNSPI